MKKKTGIIILICSVFVLLITAIVLCFTLFGLGDIEVKFKNEPSIYATQISQNELIQSANFDKRECVFFIAKEKYMDRLERENPYIKIINIETKFPNRFIIHCVEREELFALQINSEKFFICDSEFKLLKIETSFSSNSTNAILLDGEISVNNLNAKVGDMLNLGEDSNIIKQIPIALRINNRSFAEQKALFIKMTISYNTLSKIHMSIVDNNNFNIEIKYIENNLNEKFQCLFAFYNEIDISLYQTKKVVVQENEDGDMIAILADKN